MADPGISKPGAWSRRGGILRSWVCFEAILHIPSYFVVRVVNKLHVVNIVCWLKSSKYIRLIQSNFQKIIPNFFSNRGARARRAGPGSAYDFDSNWVRKYFQFVIAVKKTMNKKDMDWKCSFNHPSQSIDAMGSFYSLCKLWSMLWK